MSCEACEVNSFAKNQEKKYYANNGLVVGGESCQQLETCKEKVHIKSNNTHTRFINTSEERRKHREKQEETSMRMKKNGNYNNYRKNEDNTNYRNNKSNANYRKDKNIGYKTKSMKTATLQMLMWLLAFCAMLTFALQPVFSTKNVQLDAGWTSTDGTYYKNAPMYIAGAKEGAQDTANYTVDTTKIDPLFTTSGINASVVLDLLDKVNDSKVLSSKTKPTGSNVTYLSAKDFGQYDTATKNAQIVVKLLDTTSETTSSINTASQQLWQVVYRSVSVTEDVLTLYMVDEYARAQFNPKSPDSSTDVTYRCEGNYSQSYIRDKTVLPLYNTMKNTYSALDTYVVAPNAVPGSWQSSAYQTSRNSSRALYSTNNGVGSSGYMDGDSNYGLENGMDGQSGGHSSWSGSVEGVYSDKLWLPSGFETLHTGYGASAADTIKDTGRKFDEANDIIYLTGYSGADATISSSCNTSHTNENRTGLWELNGYDRATGSWAWLRSGYSISSTLARDIDSYGGHYSHYVYDSGGVRVALHLNLKSLAEYVGVDSLPEFPVDVELSVDSQNAGGDCIMNILQKVDTQYVPIRQIYIAKKEEVDNIVILFEPKEEYLIVISKPYYTQVTFGGDGSLVNGNYAFIPASLTNKTITITLSGGNTSNNWVVI